MLDSLLAFAENHPNEILALTALGTLTISVASLFVAAFAIFTQRRHDRAIVKPVLVVVPGNYVDDIYIKIKNVGLGPLWFDAIMFHGPNTESNTSITEALPRLRNAEHWDDYAGDLAGHVLSANGSMTLLKLSNPHGDAGVDDDLAMIRAALSPMSVKVTYRDIYKKKYVLDYKLSWFGR